MTGAELALLCVVLARAPDALACDQIGDSRWATLVASMLELEPGSQVWLYSVKVAADGAAEVKLEEKWNIPRKN